MYSWYGNTASMVNSSIYKLPVCLNNFRVVNRSASSVIMNVYHIDKDLNEYLLTPLNKSLSSGEMYSESDTNKVIPAMEYLKLTATGSVDYDFTFDNIPINRP